ncbi:hypothetical protein HMPREF1545_00342 [Oscillibacter sp. KLE 1728]|nr:hypothetical protein HMPREF1545_00342 [Oscillibacter sp. KLE 1728]ERK67131.1 hypothetical protein HMPREF1546_00638 [Oscillibacter sp. KLE 1745]
MQRLKNTDSNRLFMVFISFLRFCVERSAFHPVPKFVILPVHPIWIYELLGGLPIKITLLFPKSTFRILFCHSVGKATDLMQTNMVFYLMSSD